MKVKRTFGRHCIDGINGPYYILRWVHLGRILILMQLKKVIIFCKKKNLHFFQRVGPTRVNCDFYITITPMIDDINILNVVFQQERNALNHLLTHFPQPIFRPLLKVWQSGGNWRAKSFGSKRCTWGQAEQLWAWWLPQFTRSEVRRRLEFAQKMNEWTNIKETSA